MLLVVHSLLWCVKGWLLTCAMEVLQRLRQSDDVVDEAFGVWISVLYLFHLLLLLLPLPLSLW